jgi:ribonuclease P protein component
MNVDLVTPGRGTLVKMTQALRLNYEFSRVYNKGDFTSSRHVSLHYLHRAGSFNRLGVTASRRIKGSVRRNRIKRLLRESYRLMEDRIISGYDLILVGRDSADQPDFHQISREMAQLVSRAGLQKTGQPASQAEG